MLESNKNKKPTKKQMIEEIIPKQFEQRLKNIHIKGMMQGFEIANQMLLDYANEHNIEQVRNFCKKNIEQKDVVENIVNNVE